jgi:ribosome recycling factor
MTYKEIIDKIVPELDKAMRFLDQELSQFRTGRASPALVENIAVELYGNRMTIKEVATISVIGPRAISIQPWDKTTVLVIEKAILQSSLSINPVVQKDALIVNLPQMSDEYRKSLVKLLGEKTEGTRVIIKKWREEAWGEMQKRFRLGELSEDDKFKGKEELQKVVDYYNEKIEEKKKKKEKEIMEI